MTTRSTRSPRRRTVVALGVVLAVLAGFVVRLVDIQVVNADEHVKDSLNVAFAGAFGPAVFTGLALVGAGHGEVMLAWALPLSVVAALCFLRLPARAASAADEPGLAPA